MSTPSRTWAGTTLDDRKAARHRLLLDAGLDLLGTTGSAAVSVRAVCRHAKLTERYFYESFADREQLVLAVYEHVGAQAHQALLDAVREAPEPAARAEAAVTAFVELMVDDPRKGSVLLLAPLTDPALSQRGVELLPAFAALVREQLSSGDDVDRMLTAVGLVGALGNVFIAYLNGSLDVSRERLVAHCVRLVLGADGLTA
ncbi:MAG: TetR family transcriptional regulator [Amycolatopsis sp.]|jgi:AcrR family transcriptional regulator|uniref:TetR/AcrR family transcriptional regulator n=1 Tax=Amycolatopsis sp. TaxID=37632 RepID=UPI0026281BED|nr:TetR family transcriptional regulator [Amycolatopsis sp.]MCU1686508.1 TetR family transcriptional regulator [Amycolatopsis sp.]